MLSLFISDFTVMQLRRSWQRRDYNHEALQQRRKEACHRLGLPFDDRTRREVIQQLSSREEQAVPAIYPVIFYTRNTGIKIDRQAVNPLGGISTAVTVCGNETGKYLVYKSDEHGFRNPSGLYRPGQIDVVAVGDSFTQGTCQTDIIGVIREVFPGSLNLGYGSNGPLCSLDAIRE